MKIVLLESSSPLEIRIPISSGEYRISNFLLWQLAYAEIHVTDVFWPDFNADVLKQALLDYQGRNRRFGGLDPITP